VLFLRFEKLRNVSYDAAKYLYRLCRVCPFATVTAFVHVAYFHADLSLSWSIFMSGDWTKPPISPALDKNWRGQEPESHWFPKITTTVWLLKRLEFPEV
jgi:hypothetical protein